MEEDWLASPKLIAPSLEENQVPLYQVQGLDARILAALKASGVESLFPVQTAVLKEIVESEDGDLLVSASTGSGKTLAYLLPILQSLSDRLVCRLRALIVVPGRELALQVASVLEPFTEALSLSMAVVVGQTSLVAEQKKLVKDDDDDVWSSRVDILIATPGRLVDHLQMTPGFTLQHLQWLVIDEADRLLDQQFQDWLPQVLQSASPSTCGLESSLPLGHDAVSSRPNSLPITSMMGLDFWATPLRKLLFSATLTRNPAKLAQLHLSRPTYLAVSLDTEKYPVPADLEEHLVVVEDGQKVSALMHLLNFASLTRCLCFTKSVMATEKLAALLSRCQETRRIQAFSGELLPAKRAQILDQFNEGVIDLLICSDGAARGLDLQQVQAVINYDIPVHVKTYIHRVGRTARAGQKGQAYSILEAKEAHHFKQMLSQGRLAEKPIKKMKIKEEDLEPYKQAVQQAINDLQQ